MPIADDGAPKLNTGVVFALLAEALVSGTTQTVHAQKTSDIEAYAPQTKILERMTKEEMWIFEALVKGVSTRFGLRTIEKCFENHDFLFCHSFQNLRLGGVNMALTPLKSATTKYYERLVRTSKIFVWDG